MSETDWDRSAEAWIAAQGEMGDFTRQYVLDPVMLPRIRAGSFRNALDVGCGEGRFCRALAAEGIKATGLDPTGRLLDEARCRDPQGDYQAGVAEAMPFEDGAFDLVVSYLSLIDIPDFRAAIAEMARVLTPGGTLMVAHITGMRSALMDQGWVRDEDGTRLHYPVDRYLEERSTQVDLTGSGDVQVLNWHRPLSAYMTAFLAQGLQLTHFDHPPAVGGPAKNVESYTRVPWIVLMEWRKPA